MIFPAPVACAAAALLSCSLVSAGSARLTFTKSFPGSTPAYVSLSVERSGALQYKESPTDTQPVTATLGEAETGALFELAQKLEYFRGPLESGLKVANTGKKTFRYEDADGKATEAVFNYSLLLPANDLLQRFETIAESERAFLNLDRTSRYDHLGVNDALAEIESLWLRKQLAAPAQFVPLLTRISKHEAYMHLARDRAARLRDEFTATATPSASTSALPAPVTPISNPNQ